MSSRSYILQIMLWHQSLKSIHYRTLLIFLNKKNNRFEGQNMGGGIKDMLSPPPCQNMGGYITPIPPRIYALGYGVIYIRTKEFILYNNFLCSREEFF